MLEELKERIENEFKVDLASRQRTRKMAYLRAIYFDVAYRSLKPPLETLAPILDRKHSTVIHAIKRIIPIIEFNEPVLNEYRKELYLWMIEPDKEIAEIEAQIEVLERKKKILIETQGLCS